METTKSVELRPDDRTSLDASHWSLRRELVGLEIEKAALTLFLERGPDNTTVEDIAEAAGISRRTLFRYFESRDDVLAAQPIRAMRQSMRLVCERPAQESILEAMVAVARGEQFIADDEVARLSFAVLRKSPEPWLRAMTRLRHVTEGILTDMVSCRLRLMKHDDSAAAILGAALTAMSKRIYLDWANSGGTESYADWLDRGLRALPLISIHREPNAH